MSHYPQTTSSNPKKRSAFLLGTLLVLTVVATSFTAVSSQQAVAQATPPPANMLDASLCESTTGYKPVDGRTTDLTVAQCKALVKFRNDIFAYGGHQNLAGHSIAQWGTGTGESRRMNQWMGVRMFGNPFRVHEINISHWARRSGQQNRSRGAYLYGPIPNLNVDDPGTPGTDSNLFRGLRRVYFTGNRFTGEFPEWIYNLPGLNILELEVALSGTVDGQRFLATNLQSVNLAGNAFHGSLPDFKFRNALGQAINTGLTFLRLDGNAFTGPIPAGYSAFADGRAVRDLHLAANRLTGDIPNWVKNVKFRSTGQNVWGYFKNRMSFAGNRLCIPEGFTMPTLYEAGATTAASVQVDFSHNRCPTKKNDSIYSPGPVRDLRYEASQVAENELVVSWKPPASGSGYLYWVLPEKLVPDQIDATVSHGSLCAQEVNPVWSPPDSNGVFSATIGTAATPNCRFDLNKFAVAVRTIYEVGGPRTDYNYANAYMGETGIESGWNIVQVKERRSVQDIGFKIGLSLSGSYYSWDADTQSWVQWALEDLSLDSVYLDPGTAIITQASRPPAWLDLAGLSSADENLPIQISNGWNMISAGGDATRPDDDDAAFFFDTSLSLCDSNTGVLVVLRYSSRTGQFDAELPCHPSAEAALTARGDMDTIEEIEEYDSLFVYFSSVVPVSIVWDATNNKYISHTS